MVIERGGIHWVDFGPAVGSRPAKRRPAVVVQSNFHNHSRLATVVVAAISSNTALARYPGNVYLPSALSGLPHDSVINVTTLTTFDRRELEERIGTVPLTAMAQLDEGLRLVLGL
jgi:mRNA interferase MazF